MTPLRRINLPNAEQELSTPYISPMSPYISLYLNIPPHISLNLPISPYVSLYLPYLGRS